jgi:multiple sugar transport system ATP-binding protein
MGRAIVREPSVFLMDEPLSNLDAKLRVETRANISELQARLGTTTVYVTHDQVEAMTMGHRVAVLKDGQLQQCDTPRTLYDRPANVFVAGFMGSPAMNLVTVPLVADGVRLGESTVPLPRDVLAEAHSIGLKQVVFGVRPENITLSGVGVPVTVDLVEELGADSFVHGHGPDGDRMVIRTEAHVHPTAGATVRASVTDDKHIHVFNPDTGLRLRSSDAVPADAPIPTPVS